MKHTLDLHSFIHSSPTDSFSTPLKFNRVCKSDIFWLIFAQFKWNSYYHAQHEQNRSLSIMDLPKYVGGKVILGSWEFLSANQHLHYVIQMVHLRAGSAAEQYVLLSSLPPLWISMLIPDPHPSNIVYNLGLTWEIPTLLLSQILKWFCSKIIASCVTNMVDISVNLLCCTHHLLCHQAGLISSFKL